MKVTLYRAIVALMAATAVLFLAVSIDIPVKNELASVEEPSEPAVPEPEIEAKAALAADLLSGEIIFQKNKGELLPLASLTKIISLLTLWDMTNLDEKVQITQAAVLTPEPSSLRVGEHLRVRDLFAMAVVESSNDAVAALTEYAAKYNEIPAGGTDNWFLKKMHEKAEEFGIYGMIFYSSTGLDIDKNFAGAYGSAEQFMKVLADSRNSILWQFGEISEVVSEEGITHNLRPTNMLYSELAPLVGAKTGFTDLAGGNLAVMVEYPLGRPVGIVVLGSSEDGRFEDVKKLLDWIKTTR